MCVGRDRQQERVPSVNITARAAKPTHSTQDTPSCDVHATPVYNSPLVVVCCVRTLGRT